MTVGELLRVDAASGAACLLHSGSSLTDARFATGFHPHKPRTDPFLTSEAGEIIHMTLTRKP
jgi:hypothetical protein